MMAEPNGELLTRVDDLIQASARVEAEIVADRKAREDERAALERRMATNRRAARIAIVVGIVAVLVGIGGVLVGYRAKSTADDIIAARADARRVTCVRDNTDATKQHQLWEGLLLIPTDRPLDPAKVAQLRMVLDDTFPQRDCSPAALDAYYGGK